MTERQEFKLIHTYPEFETREYAPCVIAEIKVSAQYSAATNSAFNSLFGYISMGNETSKKIPMTAPVISAKRAEQRPTNDWYVSFVMPAGSTLDKLPFPNDPNVILRELPTETCVVSSFRGRATQKMWEKKTAELRAAALVAGIALTDETRIARFDPPFKPGFMRHNEIVIPI